MDQQVGATVDAVQQRFNVFLLIYLYQFISERGTYEQVIQTQSVHPQTSALIRHQRDRERRVARLSFYLFKHDPVF